MFAIEKTKNSAAGVPVLLGFTFFMGLMLSRLIGRCSAQANGASLIMMAFASTGAVFFGMAALSTVIKRDLSAMGKFSSSAPSWCWWRHRQLLPAVERADADAVGAGDRHLLGLHPVRPGRSGARRLRDQLHQRHAERLPWTSTTYSRVCCRCSASPAATTEAAPAASENGAGGPCFHARSKTAIDSTCAVWEHVHRPGRHVQR